MGSLEVIIQDRSGSSRVQEHLRRASYGVVHAVLLCFDISSPESFENVEHKVRMHATAAPSRLPPADTRQWNHEADLYLNKVPKILVGCKKDMNRGGSRTVWTRDVGPLLRLLE
jgi:GTPase SAR1 family protein